MDKQLANLAGVLIPGAGFVVAIKRGNPTRLENAIFAGTYAASCLGVTAGFHRQLTHRAYETPEWLRAVHAVLGSTALQGDAIDWVRHHRKHHAFSDEAGDPHSPHGYGEGWRAVVQGLPYAHFLWVLKEHDAPTERYAPDLEDDPVMIWIKNHYPHIVAVSLALPGVMTAVAERDWRQFKRGFYRSGLARAFVLLNSTFSINSICHFMGERRWNTEDESRNVWWLALPSAGESWHHNHHAFPRSAFHGLEWWEFDPTGLYIRLLRRLGLAWNVVEVSPEQKAKKLAKPPTKQKINWRAPVVAFA